jgi:hypothetical protein
MSFRLIYCGWAFGAVGRKIATVGLFCGLSAVAVLGEEPTKNADSGRVLTIEQLAADLVEQLRWIEASRAETEWMQTEIDRLRDAAPGSEFLKHLRRLKPDEQQFAVTLLEKNVDSLTRSVHGVNRNSEKDLLRLQVSLNEVRTELIRGQKLLVELDARKRFIGQLASLINVDNRWLWMWGVLAIGAFIGLCWYEQRHALRRLTWIRKSRFWTVVALLVVLIFVPLLPTLLGFLLGNQPYETLLTLTAGEGGKRLRLDDALLREVKGQRDEADKARQKVLEEYRPLAEDHLRKLKEVFGADNAAVSKWREIIASARDAFVNETVQLALAKALESDAAEMERMRGSLKTSQEEISSLARLKEFTGAGIGFGLLCATFAGGAALDWTARKQRKRIARTCPRCLTEGSLLTETTTPTGSPITDPNLYEIRCTKVISESPFQECGFTFPPLYCDRKKLSFPTLGVASSGKTHWLAMTYRELNHGRHPENVHFERVRSRGSTDFDRIIENILSSRMGPSASTLDLPHPVVFDFRDNDWPIPESVMVNVFDFAGTVTVSLGVTDATRQRQLRSDGYLFFLDPTYSSDTQAQALIEFRDQVKQVKGLRPGRKLYAPIALCLTKIDLLGIMPFAQGGDVIDRFYEDLKRIDPTGQSTSLRTLAEKSAAVGKLRDSVWPNWEIERQIRALFGERVLFFPMTPVGMNELGETDLSKRTISPYGIVQPLLWLLHMNGYPVLDP